MATDNGYCTASADAGYGDFHAIPSAAAGGHIPVLTFVPERPRATVYLLHGVNGQSRDEAGLRALVNPGSGVRELAEAFAVAVVAPIVPNRFYLDPPAGVAGARWGTAIGVELVDGIEARFPALAKGRAGRALAGFSMGGYGAISLLCRYADRFRCAASRCGHVELGSVVTDLAWDDGAWAVEVLGSYFEFPQRYHANSCPNLLNRVGSQAVGISLEVGTADHFLEANRRLRGHLLRLGLPHTYCETSDGHVMDAHALVRLLANLLPWLPAR